MANYTDINSNVQYANVVQPSFTTSGRIAKGQYVVNEETGELISTTGAVINAIDIDWNGAQLDNNLTLNTTGDLLSRVNDTYTKSESDSKYQEKGNYITEVPSLEGYATEEYVNTKISDLINEAPDALDTLKEVADTLNTKVNSSDLATVATSGSYNDLENTPDLSIYLTEHQDISGKADVESLAAVALSGSYNDLDDIPEIPDLSEFVVHTELDDITETVNSLSEAVDDLDHSLASTAESLSDQIEGLDVYTKAEADETFQAKGEYLTEHQSLEDYATKQEIAEAGYLTEHQSLENYALKTYVNEEIARVVGEAPEAFDTLKEIADKLGDNGDAISALTTQIASKAAAADVYTKAEADEAFQAKGNYLTEHQDISGKANSADLATVATTGSYNDLTDTPDLSVYLTEHQSLEGYATESYVNAAVESIIGTAPENFDTLEELAAAMSDLKVVDVEAVPAVPAVLYESVEDYNTDKGTNLTQEEFEALTEEEKIQTPAIEAVAEESHNMTISEFVNNATQAVDEKEAVAKVQAKYNALLTLLNLRESQVNSVIVNQELEESSTVTFDEPVDNIVIPETTAAYVVTGPLDDDATVTLTSNKYMTLDNTSEEPVSATVQRPAEAGETGTSGTTVYLVGQYDTLTLENVSPNVKSGRDAAIVNNVVITENNTKNLTLNLDLQDGATITNYSATAVTINDKNNEETVLAIVAPNSTVTLNGGTYTTLDATVSDNTLIIKKNAHIGDLIVKHGNVKVEVPRESDISNIITGTITFGDEHSFLIVDHTNFAEARHNQLIDYYTNYPTEASQDGETWPAFTPAKFPWLVVNHEFDGNTELQVYYQGEKVFGDWKPSAQVEQEGGTMVARTYAILSVPEDCGLTQFTETAAGNEVLLNPADIEVKLVSGSIDYLHDEITSANVSKLTSTGTHVLTENITKNGRFAPGIFASDDIIWDLNGHDITFTNTQGYANFLLRGTLHLEINGNGTVRNNAGDYGFWTATEGAKVVINGGSYYAATHVLYAENGTIEVNGGEFHLTDEATADKDQNGNFKFLLNCHDAEYTAGTAKIIVRGGKFYGFNPAVTYGEPGGPVSYVAEGYESVPINEAYEYGTVYEVRPVSE